MALGFAVAVAALLVLVLVVVLLVVVLGTRRRRRASPPRPVGSGPMGAPARPEAPATPIEVPEIPAGTTRWNDDPPYDAALASPRTAGDIAGAGQWDENGKTSAETAAEATDGSAEQERPAPEADD